MVGTVKSFAKVCKNAKNAISFVESTKYLVVKPQIASVVPRHPLNPIAFEKLNCLLRENLKSDY